MTEIVTDPPNETAASAYLPSTWKRLFATWIDGTPLMVILTIGTLPTLMQGYFHASWPVLIAGWSFTLLYHICFLYYFGATPGKILYGLKIISVEGDPSLSLGQAIVRTLVAIAGSAVFSIIPQVTALFRADRRQLGDLAAGTRVVQNTPRASPPKRRYVIGSFLMLFALIAAINTMASFGRYKISADGIQLDFVPRN